MIKNHRKVELLNIAKTITWSVFQTVTLLMCFISTILNDPILGQSKNNSTETGRKSFELESKTSLAIENVTIIDPTAVSEEKAHITNQTVLIAGHRIDRVGPADSTPIRQDLETVDGRGKYLLPGFWDMHVHFNRNRNTQLKVMAPLMIANGITSVRDMLGDCWEPCGPGRRTIAEMRELQQQVENGDVLAPRLLALSSPVVLGPRQNFGYPAEYPEFWQPKTEEEGRQLARYLKDRGVDFIKSYNSIPRTAFFALMEEANKLGIEVSGHLPWSVHPIEASNAGMRTIEHARWPGPACNPVYEEFRKMYAKFAAEESDFDVEVFARFRDAVVSKFDKELCQDIFDTLVKNDTYLVPTHLTRKMDAFAGDSDYRTDPRRKYVPPGLLQSWNRDLDNTAAGPPELLTFYREFFDFGLKITGMAHEAGVKIMVGTDVFDTQVFPGFSYHDELVHLSMAGLSPFEIIKAATYRCAEFLRMTDDFGSVAQGKVADLILLDADPLLDIRNSTKINTVIFGGTVHGRSQLDSLIQGVEDYVKSRN